MLRKAFRSSLQFVVMVIVSAVMCLAACANGRWRAAPPDESTRAPKDGTPVVKIDPAQMGLTVSVNTDSEIVSYVIDELSVAGVVPLEMPIRVMALTPGLSTRLFIKVDRDEFTKHLMEPGQKPWKLHRKVVWKDGRTVEGELSGTLTYP